MDTVKNRFAGIVTDLDLQDPERALALTSRQTNRSPR